MYSRHDAPKSPLRWIVGLIIVVSAVAAFSIYQSQLPGSTSNPAAPTEATVISPNNTTARAATPTAQVTPTATPVTFRIAVEKANLLTTIVKLYYSSADGWDLTLLNQFAGHLQGTPDIGQGGNFVLAGHVELKDGSAGPFARLNLLKAGDVITILRDDAQEPGVMRYSVTDVKTVDPYALNEIRDHGFEELTLVTCQDWNPTDRMYNKRLVVHARPITTRKP